MKTSLNFIFLFIILIVLSAFSLPGRLDKKVDKEIATYFDIDSFSKKHVVVDASLQNKVNSILKSTHFLKIEAEGKLFGYAYISKAPSKTDSFDYLILFNTDLEIIKAKVLIYREDYGNEIGSKRWLKQFVGLNSENSLQYGNNVDAISGATISAKSMTNAINNALKEVKQLKNIKIL